MRKVLSALLSAGLLLTFGSTVPAEEAVTLPAVGDEVEGFVVEEVRDYPLVGGTAVLFEHEKTGAQLMYIANNDTNRAFDLTFFTRAADQSGYPHVFEHATLDGSEKYPSAALFFNLIYQTYNTYMNASTYSRMTTYPVASLSEAQLLKYADFYTDSCLHPSIMEDERIFREEAWRYRLADAEDELSIEGTVYSEMLGSLDLNTSAYYNMLRETYPGSQIGNVSGGDPAYIPDMTWEGLKDYHDQYYHPSNCIVYLYGEYEDYTAFLALLNEAFSPYEKRTFEFEDPGYTPLAESITASYDFAAEEGSSTENKTIVYYTFACSDVERGSEEEAHLDLLSSLLAEDASPLMQALKKALPSGSFSVYLETEGPTDALVFNATNVNEEDAEVFKSVVDDALADVAENGFSQELVDASNASLSLDLKLLREESDVGVNLIAQLAYCYATLGSPFGYLDYVDSYDNIEKWNSEGVYAETINTILQDAPTALVSTSPVPGLREQEDAMEADRLAQVKAAMSEEEIQAIVDQSNAQAEEQDVSGYIAQLQAVTVESLPEEEVFYEISDTTGEDGVRYLSTVAGVDGVGRTGLFFDASGLAMEDIHWFKLYTELVGNLDTESHTDEEIASLWTRYLYNGEIRLSLMPDYETDDYSPYLRAGWTGADEDLEDGYTLMRELLFETKFDDTETILGLVQKGKNDLRSSISNEAYNVMLYRGLGLTSPYQAYYAYFNFLDYYEFLNTTEQLLLEDASYVTEKLKGIQQYFNNRTNAISIFAGNEDSIVVNTPLAENFFASLDENPIETVNYEFDVPAASEALIIDSNVQFNGIVGVNEDMGLEEYTADLDAVSSLVTDVYLIPELRDQYGVYGAFHGFTEGGSYLVSYRDPNIEETFNVYEALPAYLADLELTQDDLDGYILSAYSYYAMPSGELSGAISALANYLCNEPEGQMLQYMQELKGLTPENVSALNENYEKLVETGYRFTAGSAGAINAYADLYDVILNPFGAVDSSEVEFTDLSEDNEHYEAVRFVYENMVMMPAAEDAFGVDEPATVGDLAGVFYALIGGDPSQAEEAVETLGSYGLLPAEAVSVETELSETLADAMLSLFSAGVEVEYTAMEDATEDIMTRGELAEVVMSYLFTLE